MVSDISDKADQEERRDITSDDHDRFMERLRPYQEQVLVKKGPLSAEDISDIERMADELERTYTIESLARSGLLSALGITDLHYAREEAEEYSRLRQEYATLSQRLGGSLSREQEEEALARIEEVRAILEPDYCW